ncbi:unnamed protein product [Acanthoscelides obtectus]|uniref:BTB domain-containing protein n=1 Tax=Acanthoscelides obtectus TaxID=200917 RepID=A0A9P0PBE3_ACAOB|nr:unnamed protein product [Acanthoscelides obtectus]CAK1635742.1 Centrosome-associated zinc finger protein CP190 [Acanthoscelides obtectus]
MGEGIKQVRVDNWGIYFLQRLQMFFSRTDYCDLTLQFEGNVQLKVHRLVMNACTEYFAFLEQTCPIVEDNTIVMPEDLQSDVIVPIVNFMYTGMLEFHMSLFDKIYRAAELMDMPILIKVLEAQRHPFSTAMTDKKKKEPSLNTWAPKKTPPKPELPSPILPKKSFYKRGKQNAPSTSTNERSWLPDPLALTEPPLRYLDNAPKPTRFEWPEDVPMMMDTSFSDISLTSQPLLTKEDENRVIVASSKTKTASKEDAESTENANSTEEEKSPEVVHKRKTDQPAAKPSPKRAKVSDKENKETTINIKSNNIGDLDHTKIVSEILKKYPDLVKKNKNIRLKIMSPTAKSSDKSTVVKTANIKITGQIPKPKTQNPPPKPKPVLIDKPVASDGPWYCNKCEESGEPQEFVLYYLYRKHMQDVHNVEFDISLCKFCGKKCVKENVMAYHLYTKHGYKTSSSISFPKCDLCPYVAISIPKLASHHASHKPQERQCPCCKLAFTSNQSLALHVQLTAHRDKQVRTSCECQYCNKKTYSSIGLLLHLKSNHLKEAKRDGIVLNLTDLEQMENLNDINDSEEEEGEYITPDNIDQKDKVKIISNVKVPSQPQDHKQQIAHVVPPLEPSSEAEALNNVASGIATSLGLVDIVVLDDKGQYVLGNREDSATEYVLPDLTTGTAQNFVGQRVVQNTDGDMQPTVLPATQEVSSTDELVMVLTDHDYQEETEAAQQDNSNIVVLYSHPVDGQQGQFITSQGNLLVNSQTGMLELRNGPTMTTASSNQLIVTTATETPIESIEMIQREIDTHEAVKNRTFVQDTKAGEVHGGQDMPDINEEPAATETAPSEDAAVSGEDSQTGVTGQEGAQQLQEPGHTDEDAAQEGNNKEEIQGMCQNLWPNLSKSSV